MEFKTKPFKHQLEEFNHSKNKKFYANLSEQGTGKTKILLDQAAYLYLEGHINFLLVVAPNEVHANWIEEEIPKHLSLDEENYEAGVYRNYMKKTQEDKIRDLIDHGVKSGILKIMAMNVEGMLTKQAKATMTYILKHYNVMCVVDESTRIANPKAKVTKYMLKKAKLFTARRIATGTPIDKNPLAAWSQFEFLDPKIFGMGFVAFRAKFAILKEMAITTKSGHQVVQKFPVGYKNLEVLGKIIDDHSTRVLKKECLDLPDKLYKVIQLDMDPSQKRAYESMKKDLIFEYADVEVSAGMVLEQLLHLSRITGGFATKDEPFDNNPKLTWVKNNIDDLTSNTKVIIWARFVDELLALSKLLGPSCRLLYGDTPKDERGSILRSFRNDDDVRVLVANPRVAGLGLTLTEASIQIYYSNSYSLETRRQSEDRIHRIGQTVKCTYYDLIMRGTIDEAIVSNLRQKRDISDVVLKDPFENWI